MGACLVRRGLLYGLHKLLLRPYLFPVASLQVFLAAMSIRPNERLWLITRMALFSV